MPCAWLLDSLIYKCSLAGLTAGWSSGVWRRWSTRTGWPRMKTFGSHRSGASTNKFRNCLGIKIFVFFFKLSGSTTQRTRRQRWTTQSLGRQSKNLAALKYPHLQGDSILSKKGKRCKMYIIDSTTFDFQFGEYAAIWGLREQADSNENLQYQLYLHLWPYMVRHFFLYIDDGNAQSMSKKEVIFTII